MGAYSTVLPGGLPLNEENAERFSQRWGFDVHAGAGLTAPEMLDAAHDGTLDVLVSSGGNFLKVLPDPAYCREAVARIPLRVHIGIVMSSQMLVDPADTVVLLPAQTRYEMVGGVTETTTERRVVFSPEIEGPRIDEARPEWQIFADIAAAAAPDRADKVRFAGTPEIRREIAEAIPMYQGIEMLEKFGDQFQYGGTMLCAGWKFPTPDGKAHFSVVTPPKVDVPEGHFMVATRRGKQFNSIVHEATDSLTGAVREAILISRPDAERLTIRDGDWLVLRNSFGEFRGRATLAPVTPGSLQVHWPEGQMLLDRRRRSPQAGIPDYNAAVTLEKVG
jgi:predicted molibdopterin-dependent oxidoreductase YjgC